MLAWLGAALCAVASGQTAAPEGGLRGGAPSLAAYMDAAVAHHPRSVIAAAGVDSAHADVVDAGASLLPTVRGNASLAYNQYEAVAYLPDPQGGPPDEIVIVPRSQYQATLSARVPLLDAPSFARWRASRLGADAVEADARATEQDLRLDVARAWYAAAAAQEVVAAAERARSAADENVRYLTLRAEAGAATLLSVQRAELEAANAELLVIDGRRAWLTARRELATLVGLPEVESLPITGAATGSDPLPPEQTLLDQANGARPEIAAAEARLDQLRTAAGAAWLGYAPTVAAVGSEQITNASGFSGQSASWRVGLELDWLLLEVGDRASDLRRARSARVVAEANLELARNNVRDEVHGAWLAAEAAAAKVTAARRGAEVGLAAAEDVRARFQAGTATQLEVIQAERDALDAEVRRIRAEGEDAVARLALTRAAGGDVRP